MSCEVIRNGPIGKSRMWTVEGPASAGTDPGGGWKTLFSPLKTRAARIFAGCEEICQKNRRISLVIN